MNALPGQASVPTPVPMAALDLRACPLSGVRLIEASAGTGKTWNICGLYLRLLLERGLDVREILVVSFTRSATAELRLRIRARLAELLAGLVDPDAVVDPLVAGLIEDAIERTGIDPEAVSPDHWRHVHNRLTAGHEPRAYTLEHHRAFLLRRRAEP